MRFPVHGCREAEATLLTSGQGADELHGKNLPAQAEAGKVHAEIQLVLRPRIARICVRHDKRDTGAGDRGQGQTGG